MATLYPAFYTPLRLLLGDSDAYGVRAYEDGTLSDALRAVFQLGRGPFGFTADDSGITPDVPDGNGFAVLCYEAAVILLGGEDDAAYETRAIKVKKSDRVMRLLGMLQQKLYDIRDGGDGFSSSQSFYDWVHGITSLGQIVPFEADGFPLLSIGWDGRIA